MFGEKRCGLSFEILEGLLNLMWFVGLVVFKYFDV